MYSQVNHYYIGPTLGEGGFGKVKKVYSYFTEKYYAMKILKRDKQNFNSQLVLQEAKVMNRLKGENVPTLFDYYESISYVKKNGHKYEVAAIVMEYLPNGTLFHYVQASETGFPEEIARNLFGSLIQTIEKIHNQDIAHRDLKIQNLLLDENFNLKIGDFGLATQFRNEQGIIPLEGKWGTRKYMAPEIWLNTFYNAAPVDVFSCGVILFNLITANAPFKIADPIEDSLYKMIAFREYDSFWEHFEKKLNKTFSIEVKDLINHLLAFKPSERPSLRKIQDHFWFNYALLDPQNLKESLSVLQEKVNALTDRERIQRKEKAAEKKANQMQKEY